MLHTNMQKCIVTQTNYQNYHFVVHNPNLVDKKGSSNHSHLRFDPKVGNGVCAIIHIPCACVSCTSIPDKPRISSIPLKTITLSTCHQLHLLASPRFIQQLEHHTMSHKSTPYDAYDEIHQVVLDGISDNMA